MINRFSGFGYKKDVVQYNETQEKIWKSETRVFKKEYKKTVAGNATPGFAFPRGN